MNESDNHDDFDARARAAGAALRRNAPDDLMDTLHHARRRRQATRAVVTGGGALALVAAVVLGAAALRGDDSTTPVSPPVSVESPDPAAGPSSTLGSTTSTTSTPVSGELALGYTFDGTVIGLSPFTYPAVEIASDDELRTIWTSAGGFAESFLTLSDIDASTVPSTTPEGDVTATPLDVSNGTAWLVVDNVEGDAPAASIRIMWWRDDGRLWVISHYGMSATQFTGLALSIQPGSGVPHLLADESMNFAGTSSLTQFRSIRQSFTLEDRTVQLGVTEGGPAQVLVGVTASSVSEVEIAGTTGYRIELPNGQVNVFWPTGDGDRWGSLIVNTDIAGRADEIIAAVVPSG